MSGWNQTLSLGDGNNTVSGSQGSSTLTVGNGRNTIGMGGWNNTITTGSGQNSITAGDGNETVDTTSGSDVVKLSGWNNLVIGGIGADVISGGASNVYRVNGTGSVGGMDITDFGTANNDLLDVSKILASSGWNGSSATLGGFLNVSETGSGSTLVGIDVTGHGSHFATVATLGGAVAASVSDLVNRNAIRLS
jgi:Ca2+-binding RTX toxin-like protein